MPRLPGRYPISALVSLLAAVGLVLPLVPGGAMPLTVRAAEMDKASVTTEHVQGVPAPPSAAPVSRYGPHASSSAQDTPAHAYSPFDDTPLPQAADPVEGREFMPGRVLIKLAPEAGIGALDAQIISEDILTMQRVFPRATPPRPDEKVITSAEEGAEAIDKPDLTRWFQASLSPEADVLAVVEALKEDPAVAYAEPDYLRRPTGDPFWGQASAPGAAAPPSVRGATAETDFAALALPDASSDPLYAQQWHLGAANVLAAWAWLESNGYVPGGSRDIVVAVIDTGVDYTHPDLAANIWTNSQEIPGNGVDDDHNGYVDDVHGADTVTPDGNPLDDHGHGTHVAGIVAAQAGNGIGGVGVAYNVQVMPLKAAQYSGVLAVSDIAEAIYYAVEKGADVINMSFGGYRRSQIEEDALAVAFGQAVLVAAAGNDAKVNPPCSRGQDMYPAAYNWVLGVMASKQASDSQGWRATFSNYDCVPHDTHEYELMAPGVDVWSTLPGTRYAAWDGTSMATPIVSGLAALARTRWSDKNVYPSRFIMGQIAANAAPVANALGALTVPPRPELTYLQHWLFDTAEQHLGNDDDGVVDAGETIDLAIVIRNHWGKADPVTVTLDAWAEGAVGPDPYVTMITDTVDYGAVGSFNQDDNGLIYDAEGVITGVRRPFRFTVDPNTPNDHLIPFRLRLSADNGYDSGDPNTPYTFVSRFNLIVQRGRELPRIIDEDMVLTKDDFWLVPDGTLIEPGVTVTIMEGTRIQFWSVPPSDPYAGELFPYIQVEGSLIAEGTLEEPIEIFPGPFYPFSIVKILNVSAGHTDFSYVRWVNPYTNGSTRLDHCELFQEPIGYITGYFSHGSTMTDVQVNRSRLKNFTFAYEVGGSNFGWAFNNWTISTSLCDHCLSRPKAANIDNSVFLINAKDQYAWPGLPPSYFSGIGQPSSSFIDNVILNRWWIPDTTKWMTLRDPGPRGSTLDISSTYWGGASQTLIDHAIVDYQDDFNLGQYVYQPILVLPPETAYPFAVDVILSASGHTGMSSLSGPTPLVGAEPVTFTVTFNRDMDTAVQPQVSFGPDVPMTDYTVHSVGGGWVNPRTWVGTFSINPITGDGYQLIRVAGGVAADDPWLVTGDDAGRFRFEIITSGTESMNLQATGGEGYVDLAWTQDDFELLAGFNLYRSTSQEGTYTRLNSGIIPSDQRSYRDTAVQPGQPYYYKFTVVKTDMTESDYSNVASATPTDTVPPQISHTPVTEGAPGLPLTLTADATDNVGVQSVTLFYRAAGATGYSNKPMVRTTSNRYAATIEGSLMASPGVEYYLEASDGVSITRAGRADNPYRITVVDRPVVTVVSPGSGPASGGTPVTVAGSNFKPGASVRFGGAVASDVVVLSTSQITCTTPAHFPAAVDVTVVNTDTQSGTLLRGFTYLSDVTTVSLPDTGGEQSAIVDVPVNLANVQGLAAADLTITFDPAVLAARGARAGTLTPGWSMAVNTNTAGQVRLSMASPGGTVTGSGSLAILEIEVLGAPTMTSTLHLAAVSLNDGAIAVELLDGSFAVNQAYAVAGAARHWQGGAGVPGVQLDLVGDRTYSALTTATGAYTVSGARLGAYTLTPTKSDGANGISAYDASFVLQHAAGLTTLTGHNATAGDVNKNGAVSSMDAYYILQKAVDLLVLPFPGAGRVWDFSPASRSYASLGSDLSGQDFTAILLGDVSGNWSALGGSSMNVAEATGMSLVLGALEPSGQVKVTLSLISPVQPVYSVEALLRYSPDVARPVSFEAGALAADFLSSANFGQSGVVRLAQAGALPLVVGGDLMVITFQRVSGAQGDLQVSMIAGQVNESDQPPVPPPTPRPTDNRVYLPAVMKLSAE